MPTSSGDIEVRRQDSTLGDLLRIALAILLPPLGVLFEVGIANKHFWINILLTLLGFLPGVIHAVWVIARY
ncbi:YqaE/Pmp3 family membrane protein [Roseospira navarrensis]|uniref:YqaE/Pmp3 family membrane protein n=1 Tax=Roseospira navarrensis TaxID=140058 RepID=A0A7X1ZG59_9PROT|nr:YqaE/Pmp3 family membrane protein [Roseospira navarrensis]MQX37949.1 YqaE/Pmp3 family membrane protein [Roseospira navarrensis]